MKALLHPLAMTLPLIPLLTWLCVNGIGPQGARYVLAQRNVARVSLGEAALQSDVLQARAGLLRNDDPLVADMNAFEEAAAGLRALSMVPARDQDLPVALQSLVARDAVALERFKTDNALLQNSLSYFDVLDTQLAGSEVTPVLAASIRALGNAVLHLIRDPSARLQNSARERLDAVAALVAAGGPRSGEATLLVVHARMLARLLPAVDEDLKALFAISTDDLRQAIRHSQDARRSEEESRAADFRLALYGVGVLLVVLLVRAGRQRRITLQLQRESAELERVVAELSARFIAAPLDESEEMFAFMLRHLGTAFGADRAYLLLPQTPAQSQSRSQSWSIPAIGFPRGWPERVLAPVMDATEEADDLLDLAVASRSAPGPLRDTVLGAGVAHWCGFVIRKEAHRVGLLAFERLEGAGPWPRGGAGSVRMAGEVVSYAVQRLLVARDRAALEARLSQAERLEAVGALASGIAHNFNNLIAAVLGHAEMGADAAPADSAPAFHLREIRRAGARAQEMVGRILDFGTRASARFRPVAIDALLNEVRSVLGVLLPEGVTLAVEPPHTGLLVHGDALQLQQVFVNLGRNAMEAMSGAGHLAFHVSGLRVDRPAELAQGTLPAGEYVRISVSDTGRGMDAALLESIFQPFFTARVGGTGLGLATARDIVHDHGGAIDVRSEPGRGSDFVVWLAVAGAEAGTADPVVPRRGAGQTVLVVTPDAQEVLRDEEMLAALSYEPVGFHDLAEALAAVQASPGRFDALLLGAPRLNNAAVTTAARLRAVLPGRPVVLALHHSVGAGTDTAGLTRLGVAAVLVRPLRSAALADALARALDGMAES